MKKKKLFNTSEYKTVSELRTTLEGSGFYIHPEMQVKNVIEIEQDDETSKKDRSTFNNASFDFVIYNKESFPEFVIEFDGPHHSIYNEKRKADVRKNRLCAQARLPLLRIDDSFLKKYDKISFLKFVVERFVAWKNKIEDISQEIDERLTFAATTKKGLDYDDPWNDPSFIFDINHPFPPTVKIAERLFKKYQIVTSYIDVETYHAATSICPYIEFRRDKMGGGPIGKYSRRIDRTYQLEKVIEDTSGKLDFEKLHYLNVSVEYIWGYPTIDQNEVIQLHSVPTIIFQEIPGTSMWDLSDHFCDFLAFSDLEEWAETRMTMKM